MAVKDAVMQEQASKGVTLPPNTLRTKVAVVLCVTIVTLLAAVTLVLAMQERRAFLREETEKGIFVAEALADLIAREGGLARADRVRRLVADYGRMAGVTSVRVVDPGFNVIAAVRFDHIGRMYRDPDIVEAVKHGTTVTKIRAQSAPSVLNVVAPIRIDGRLAGAIEIMLDMATVQTKFRAFVQRGILVALVVAGTTTLLLLWSLTLVVVRPITRFAMVSQGLARGNFDVEIPPGGSDEIGQLGRALAKMRDSLREMSAVWKDQSPLTGLPGNLAIQRELRRAIDAGKPRVVLYADLQAFKAFNDLYGFDRGDQLLRFTGKVLSETLGVLGGEGDFLGHVGGDDFVIVIDSDRARPLAAEAIRRFDADVGRFYDEEDRQLGHKVTRTREGRQQRVPLTSLSIVGVPVGERPMSVLRIGETVAELKAYAKRTPGSKLVMDRRKK